MKESSCCGSKNLSTDPVSDKKLLCCSSEGAVHGDDTSCCSAKHVSSGGVIDPVCSMTLELSNTTINVQHKGEIYYFCNSICRDSFVNDPEKYLSPTH